MKTEVKSTNFEKESKEKLFIGIDTHKKSWKVAIYSEHLEHKVFTMNPKPEQLNNYLRKNFPDYSYKSVYEAGFSGFWTCQQLNELGIECIVVNPSDVPTKDKERKQKSDPNDCRKLGRSLRANELDSIYVPSDQALKDRQLLRTREQLVKDITRSKNRIKSNLNFYGVDTPDELARSRWSQKYIQWLESMTLNSESGDISMQSLIKELKEQQLIKDSLTKSIYKLSESEAYKPIVDLLITIPGIGRLACMAIITEIIDIRRFKSDDQLSSYVGIIPSVRSSGEKEYVGKMTMRGKNFIKKIIIECSWKAAQHDPSMLLAFNKLAGRMNKNKAIVRISRKLLNRIRSVWMNQKPYEIRVG